MKAVDLFCGAGGFSCGAHSAGINVVSAYDIDPVLTSSFSHNFPKTKLFISDIKNLTGQRVLEQLGDESVDCVFGGPPCQGFSAIGKRDKADPRRELLRHFFRLVSEIQPEYFVMENVVGLSYANALPSLHAAMSLIEDDYEVHGPVVLNASDFGAATDRERIFVIGAKRLGARLPKLETLSRRPPATVRDAIADLQEAIPVEENAEGFDIWRLPLQNGLSSYAQSLRSPDNLFTGNRRTKHSRRVVNRFAALNQGQRDSVGRHPRLSWSGRCPTLRAGTGSDKGSYQSVRPIHPEEPRVITVREAARLQGFPDSHRFHPTIWHSFRMIGNSVSPFVANAIFEVLLREYDSRAISAAAVKSRDEQNASLVESAV